MPDGSNYQFPVSGPTPAPGETVLQTPPKTQPIPSSIASGTSCLKKNSELLSKLGFNDPMIDCQWHLMNRQQKISNSLTSEADGFYAIEGPSGVDLNAVEAYAQGFSGKGIHIHITDDSFAITHQDFAANYDKTFSVACGGKVGQDPSPGLNSRDSHGVMVSGLAGAVGKNGIGVSGVAYQAKVSGHNVFDCNSTDQSYSASTGIDIWNASWGNTPDSKFITKQTNMLAVEDGIKRGISYFVAAGNEKYELGGKVGNGYSDCNFDEDNSPYLIHVAALGIKGIATSYSIPGANIFISSFGGLEKVEPEDIDKDPGMLTILRSRSGELTYTTEMNGTSAASPIAAGAAAVIKSANPKLSPIDLMYILARTATPLSSEQRSGSDGLGNTLGINGEEYVNWSKNNQNYYFSFDTGFGKINLGLAATYAKNYVPRLKLPEKYSVSFNNGSIPSTDQSPIEIKSKSCETKSFTINNNFQVFSNEFALDLVANNTSLGNAVIFFTMPSKVKAQLKRYNGPNLQGSGFAYSQKWIAYAAFAENAKGTWQMTICHAGNSGSFTWKSTQMEVYGFRDLASLGPK